MNVILCSYVLWHTHAYTIVFITMQQQWTALHLAVQDGHDSVVEILIKYGAEVNAAEVVNNLLIIISTVILNFLLHI